MATSPLEQYLKALDNKDLVAMEMIVSEKIELILPNGIRIYGKGEFLDFHKDWFSENTWTMDNRIVSEYHTENVARYLLDITYTDTEEPDNPIEIYYFLSLVFEMKHGVWQLILDQNTLKRHSS